MEIEKCYEHSCGERRKPNAHGNISGKNGKIYPPDREEIGRASWLVLHTMSANYPTNPTEEDKKKHFHFFHAFANLYPCYICKLDLLEHLKSYKINCEGRTEMATFMFNLHNKVNEDIGKALFPCGHIQEIIDMYRTAD
ncbi:FAD-linked sulfhydryl oxidase ERV1, putative [Plasmodium knowlesi strain H]|uniref:Sulfhydryl oxidase n=3 Tax=Plasmodium knowlesi TaxID=5850 RepID=A0A5K1UYX1_PLAKH|nr:FAD-linked sulfhydryl oxidase ERV1, putative [Plasmodium knowlesi strain H]OTN66299.1 Sulfhydryl oxidase [Plasmodium knowlesi]CAA9986301.1 FAD-linked sulfhydryl oxidase ERV1, putative [Plasmodium knowlesi strain H]SBO25530.1 FAD-linked sulfhydryl oxidase ERV1, putative [Plasmodium knowlesi strain H]SBO28285.1 FAD-linked sulfhydryl oxidase ERV1, putative [Plasmodium knowlesi strain H]VVS75775.1 FAD-linked sulfhydryl oxidase ERV1, putative [Plasmodium knowlesi strain H]|eukprot:XP_002257707.1 Hepatopoietin-like protein, putative [Plasmodium knowlesi strain H]